MQTLYYSTTNFFRPQEKVVDLDAYRRDRQAWEEEPQEERPAHRQPTQRRRENFSSRFRGMLDICATCAVIFTTVTLALQCLL